LQANDKTALVVHHDLATVTQYFDWIILLNSRIVASGPTQSVFTADNLRKTYGGNLSLLAEAGHALSQLGRPLS
jgi:manganese/zinc/iron transport system ATP- binding protein